MAQLFFSKFDVTRQVFFRTALSYGVVNLKPIVPGHVLVVPNRVVHRLSDLTHEEVSDLFGSVQKIGGVVEKVYKANALTVAVQDGEAAGQSVPHLHVHILPRKWVDFDGHNDRVYPALEANEEDLSKGLPRLEQQSEARQRAEIKVDDAAREPRSLEDMEKEASWLSEFFKAP
ncbi:hypothetical protein FRB94_001708 [Tulasnella sp. JGI-2019a]|nr:hypothetical protein FRB93_007199 [Tulasnella sp. JGI-2019a]KAG9013603.1 hypothetical protein FRB94_001708 [Tulasnella sp. JGI-2019a]KAG9035112.1 hypothetical protein FRB95_011979 [Tulasnella sp. JGI-2019a]